MTDLDKAAELVRAGTPDQEVRGYLVGQGMTAADAAGTIRRIPETAITPERARAVSAQEGSGKILTGIALMGLGAWNITHGTDRSGDMGMAAFGLLMVPVGVVMLIVGIVRKARA